jgi:hypothetical protein
MFEKTGIKFKDRYVNYHFVFLPLLIHFIFSDGPFMKQIDLFPGLSKCGKTN